MRAINDLAMAGNDLVGSHGTGIADVVDAQQDDQVTCAGLHQYVTIEACQCVRAILVMQDLVAGDARVEHRHLAAALLRVQSLGKTIRPALVGVRG